MRISAKRAIQNSQGCRELHSAGRLRIPNFARSVEAGECQRSAKLGELASCTKKFVILGKRGKLAFEPPDSACPEPSFESPCVVPGGLHLTGGPARSPALRRISTPIFPHSLLFICLQPLLHATHARCQHSNRIRLASPLHPRRNLSLPLCLLASLLPTQRWDHYVRIHLLVTRLP